MRVAAACLALVLTSTSVARADAPVSPPRSEPAPRSAAGPSGALPARPETAHDEQARRDRVLGTILWGVVAFEVAAAAAVTSLFAFHVDDDLQQNLLILSPFAVAGLTTLPAYLAEWSWQSALAVHGAAWGSVPGMLLGGLLQGALSDDDAVLDLGPLVFLLGGAGLVAGAFVGGLEVDREEVGGFLAPGPMSVLAEIVVLGVLTIGNFLAGDDPDFFEPAAAWSALAVSSLAVGISFAWALWP